MFADSMLETSWAQRSRRSWMTLTSFGLQVLVVGLLLWILKVSAVLTVRATAGFISASVLRNEKRREMSCQTSWRKPDP